MCRQVRGYPAGSGAKIVSVFSGNASRGLPIINALVVLVDPDTGVPIGLIEGGAMTALRTGAVSGAASDLLARRDARVLTVIGAGVQGVTQAAAVAAVRSLEKIYIVDLNEESAGDVCGTVGDVGQRSISHRRGRH